MRRETGFEVLYNKRGLILMKRFLERFRHALFRPFRASSYKNSWQQLSRPSKANASKANLVGSSTSNSACVARFVIVKKAISFEDCRQAVGLGSFSPTREFQPLDKACHYSSDHVSNCWEVPTNYPWAPTQRSGLYQALATYLGAQNITQTLSGDA